MPLYMQPLYEESSSRSMTATFLGLNRNLRCAEGEFFAMKNMTSDDAPVLSVRGRRYVPKYFQATNPTDVIGGVGAATLTGGICWIDGTVLRIGAIPVDLSKYGFEADGKDRQLVKLGAYLIVVPDMIYVNTATLGKAGVEVDAGKIEDSFTYEHPGDEEQLYMAARVCDFDGNGPTYEQNEEPAGTTNKPLKNGDTWHKTELSPGLYRYSEEQGKWYEIQSYLDIALHDREGPEPFEMKNRILAGDSLRISGMGPEVDGVHLVQNVKYPAIEEGTPADLHRKLTESFIIEGCLKYTSVETTETVTIERVIPRMDYVCEAGNRLWGCRYGDDGHGNFVNEIYCSARGDFYRWIAGESTNDDAPVTFSVGVDGMWTGAVNYQGYPTFFKKGSMHRVSGYGASGFALYDTPCIGVQEGAHRSLAVVNNVLYYKAEHAIMGFDGSTPVSVSDKLGRLSRYNNAVGGACGGKYYVSMWITDPWGGVREPALYVWDTERGLWHMEDSVECESMASDGDNLYFVEVTRKESGVSHTIKAVRIPDYMNQLEVTDAEKEKSMIPWYAETGIIGLETPDAKYISKLAIRLHMEAGATVRVMVQYNSTGYWKQIMATEAPAMKTVTMPVMPARCDHMRLRLEGVGGCKVYSITKTMENAEEV